MNISRPQPGQRNVVVVLPVELEGGLMRESFELVRVTSFGTTDSSEAPTVRLAP